MLITLDGPAGSGKTTLAMQLAQRMNFFCLNSGFLYRALAYVLQKEYGYTLDTIQNLDIAIVAKIFHSGQLCYQYDQGQAIILWQKVNITYHLKDDLISKMTALLAQNDQARQFIRAYEKSLTEGRDVVVEGRACGSVVYPHADVKFYVTASIDVRAKRFVADQAKRGVTFNFEQAFEKVHARDLMDSLRAVEPLTCPHDAIILDSTDVSAQQLLDRAIEIICKKQTMQHEVFCEK